MASFCMAPTAIDSYNKIGGLVSIARTKVYLTSPGPSEIGHNSFSSQPILKPLRPVDSLLASKSSDTSIKNEVGCRDDTMPKTVDTRRHCEEE